MDMLHLKKISPLLILTFMGVPALAQPLAKENWEQYITLSAGIGPEYAAAGARADVPLTRDSGFFIASGVGLAAGVRYRPFDVVPRLGFGVMHGTVAVIEKTSEYNYEPDEPYYATSLMLTFAPQYDRFSFSGGVSYIIDSLPKKSSDDVYIKEKGDAHWQASLGVHLPFCIPFMGKFHGK